MTTDTVIPKVWSFCHTLRDDGVGYGDYLEQLTFLLFLKMADEFGKPPHNRDVGVPPEYSWAQLRSKKGAELEVQYVDTLPEPDILAEEIIENVEAGLQSFRNVVRTLNSN